jgi:hypothetical protein
MGIGRDVVCGICGLVACVCASTTGFIEATHSRQGDLWVFTRVVEDDHNHRDYDRNVRNVIAAYTDTTSLSATPITPLRAVEDISRLIVPQRD